VQIRRQRRIGGVDALSSLQHNPQLTPVIFLQPSNNKSIHPINLPLILSANHAACRYAATVRTGVVGNAVHGEEPHITTSGSGSHAGPFCSVGKEGENRGAA
jgi:hypothetical protein